MDAAVIGAAAGVIAIPIGFIQWSSARAQARSAEVDLLRAMRSDWLALKVQWHRAILTAVGPDSYYSPADPAMRDKFSRLIADMIAAPDLDSADWHAWHQDTRNRSHEFEQAERDVLFFLATLASAVFRGRLSPELAYTVVGLDVVRRSRQIRVLLGESSASWSFETEEEKREAAEETAGRSEEEIEALILAAASGELEVEAVSCPWVYWVDSLPGLTDRVIGLLDVLWAEAARRYDMQTHDLVAAAQIKRESGSGLRNRLRVRRLAREHGSRVTGWRLERGLLAVEFLRLGPPRRFAYPALEFVPPELRGWECGVSLGAPRPFFPESCGSPRRGKPIHHPSNRGRKRLTMRRQTRFRTTLTRDFVHAPVQPLVLHKAVGACAGLR
jgi:hypothetical protein